MLPKDPNILLSYVNTKLRDSYPTLNELAIAEDIDQEEILKKLASAGFTYDEESNRFI
ncbi:MAG: DUF4250 domain-containing protein [Lachnospiraceae bacterium]|nr:DUF4250 domain-containing protein [Lachnospiraceae bacterium]MBR6274721.1 DUF4250 domain-containing protein [Lachnospiraceae bacterium]